MNVPSGTVGAVQRYSSSLPCERAVVQRGAPPNSSGNLTQCVCKISLSKKSCQLNEKKLMTNYWNFLSFTRIQISIPPPVLYRKWNVFSQAHAACLFKYKFISNLNIFHSLSTNTSPSKHENHQLHQIDDFYCYSSKKSIFANFLRYMWCEKWSKIVLKQNGGNRLDNFFHYIFFTVFSCILWHAIL